MNKRDLNAVLLASVLGSAIFVAPVMAQEVAQDPLDVDNPVMETSVTSGWWNDYYIDNGVIVKSAFKTIDGHTYYFDEDGHIYKGGMYEINGKTYSFSEQGWMAFNQLTSKLNASGSYDLYVVDMNGVVDTTPGWKTLDFQWYYAGDGGVLLRSCWHEENGNKYYLDENGMMVVSTTIRIDGKAYYFDENGKCIDGLDLYTGWKEYHGQWYYYQNGVSNYTGIVDGYYVSSGIMQTNELVENETYYVDFNGKVKKGWIFLDNSYYYGDLATGELVDGWQQINGQSYYFKNKKMVTGYVELSDGVYQFNESGALVRKVDTNSWYKDPATNLWQYVNSEGKINTELKIVVGDTTYYFSQQTVVGRIGNFGLAENRPWQDSNGKMYWTNASGTGFDMSDGLKKSEFGYVSYIQNGDFYKGFKTMNGKEYYFGSDGIVISNAITEDGYTLLLGEDGDIQDIKEGWNQYNGKWFYIKDGVLMKKTVIDNTYVDYDGFSPSGYTLVNWRPFLLNLGQIVKNTLYKFDAYNGRWYQSDENGRIVTNQWVNNRYFDAYGVMATNTKIGNDYVGADGLRQNKQETVKAGWIQKNSNWMYVQEDGTYIKNCFKTIQNQVYYFDSNGYMVTGWQKIHGEDYYFNASGIMVQNAWCGAYYLGPSGMMATNAFTPDGYYVGATGAYLTNTWIVHEGKDYYLNGSGFVVKDAWVGDYYLGRDGVMLTNAWAGNYWCGADGKYVRSAWVDHGKYYVGANGIYVTNQWIGDYYLNGAGLVTKNAWVGNYWCGSDGKYVKSSWVDNNRYYVNENGVYVAGRWVQYGSRWCYYAGNVYAKNITLNIGGTAYTFDSEGYLVK